MELQDLVGIHVLTGVDKDSDGDATSLHFRLDGHTYTVSEDPCDNYRSCMKEIRVSDQAISNTFPGLAVLASMGEDEDADILQFRSCHNGKLVLTIGTKDTMDYYPCFVADYQPSNMPVND